MLFNVFLTESLGAFLLWSGESGAMGGPGSAAPAGQLRPWNEYQVIMWVGDSAYRQPQKLPVFFQRLREMGVTAAMVHGVGADPQPLLANQFPYYVENIVNKGLCLKWNSRVRDWDKFVTAWAPTRDEAALAREYCLDDPQWRAWAKDQMRAAARQHAAHQPLAYDIRDELSVTVSANPFDYDFSPFALARFRDWLKTQYDDLAALNRQWETRFASWDEVKPFTTDQIKNRMASGEALPHGKPDWQALQRLRFDLAQARQTPTRWNFSPWADFRTYMDISLASALADLRAAAHEVDPRTPAGIEGAQMPHAFGGYDLHRLAKVLDWIELYDISNSREIFGSFMPGRPFLTTVFEQETNPARRRLWRLLLEGDRGCIIWWSEDCIDWSAAGYALTPKARALAPVLKEMTSPLARLFLRARRVYDPIAILYSQPSIQVDWLLESCVDGSTWLRRFSSFEAEHNRQARVRNSWLKALQDLGYSPRFVAADELPSKGALDNIVALVLPTALALADKEAAAVRAFLAAATEGQPRVVLSDGTPALFDEHGKLRPRSPLEDVFAPALSQERCFVAPGPAARPAAARAGDISAYAAERLAQNPQLDWAQWIGENVRHLPREASVPLPARVAVYRYTLGKARLLAFERNINYQISEDLKQAGGNQRLETPLTLTATLAQAAHVYDLRRQAHLGHTSQLQFTLDPWQPALFAMLSEKAPPDTLIHLLLQQAGVE